VISWIVASHDPAILDSVLRPSLHLAPGDELVVVPDARSIAEAYNGGQRLAQNPIRAYVHHDVQVLDHTRLREQLLTWCRPHIGMVGVVGSWCRAVPWWNGAHCGAVVDSRHGVLGTGRGGQCAYLDGLLLATCQDVVWDESYPGWHGYDHDMCEQMLHKGLMNWCLDNGDVLVRHNTTGATDPAQLAGFHQAMARFGEKWPSGGRSSNEEVSHGQGSS
jgi:glycosyl transferase family 2